jgi:AcrR family transcriptional regulator
MKTIEARLATGSLLSSALAVFEKKGYAATRVEDILEAAGIARRTFYRHFKSKDDVLTALYGVAMNEILAAMSIASDETDPLRGVHRAIDVYLDYHLENAATLRVLLGQAVRSDSPLHAMRRQFRSALVKILSEVARSRKKDFDPLVFVALISALEGLSLEVLDDGGKRRDLDVARKTAHALVTTVFESSREFPRAR